LNIVNKTAPTPNNARPASQYCQLENETPTNTLLIFLLTIVSISSRSSALLLLLAFHSESCSNRRVSPRRFLTCTMGWRAGFVRGFSSGGDQTRIRNLSSFLLTKKETKMSYKCKKITVTPRIPNTHSPPSSPTAGTVKKGAGVETGEGSLLARRTLRTDTDQPPSGAEKRAEKRVEECKTKSEH